MLRNRASPRQPIARCSQHHPGRAGTISGRIESAKQFWSGKSSPRTIFPTSFPMHAERRPSMGCGTRSTQEGISAVRCGRRDRENRCPGSGWRQPGHHSSEGAGGRVGTGRARRPRPGLDPVDVATPLQAGPSRCARRRRAWRCVGRQALRLRRVRRRRPDHPDVSRTDEAGEAGRRCIGNPLASSQRAGHPCDRRDGMRLAPHRTHADRRHRREERRGSGARFDAPERRLSDVDPSGRHPPSRPWGEWSTHHPSAPRRTGGGQAPT